MDLKTSFKLHLVSIWVMLRCDITEHHNNHLQFTWALFLHLRFIFILTSHTLTFMWRWCSSSVYLLTDITCTWTTHTQHNTCICSEYSTTCEERQRMTSHKHNKKRFCVCLYLFFDAQHIDSHQTSFGSYETLRESFVLYEMNKSHSDIMRFIKHKTDSQRWFSHVFQAFNWSSVTHMKDSVPFISLMFMIFWLCF